MPMKKHMPEQIVTLPWQVVVELVTGNSTPQAGKEKK
jgi:hypothetical protein